MYKNIIINFSSNIGDVILSLPCLDALKASYPGARITAIASLKTKEFLLKNSFVDEVVVFDKAWGAFSKAKFTLSLRGKYDLIVDFKNSLLAILLGIRQHTSFLRVFPKNTHITDKNMALVKKFLKDAPVKRGDFILTQEEKERLSSLDPKRSLFIACSSRSLVKRYCRKYLKELVETLLQKHSIVILGEAKEREFYSDILNLRGVIDLVGKTSMIEVFHLLKDYAILIIGVDSSLMHMASYLGIPAIGFFGPTSPGRSYPKSLGSISLRNESLECMPCEKAKCRFDHECMEIEPKRVIEAVNKILGSK